MVVTNVIGGLKAFGWCGSGWFRFRR